MAKPTDLDSRFTLMRSRRVDLSVWRMMQRIAGHSFLLDEVLSSGVRNGSRKSTCLSRHIYAPPFKDVIRRC